MNIMRKILLFTLAMIAGSTLLFADDEVYELVTSANSLAAGDEVIITYLSGSTYYAMGAKSGNYRSAVNVSVSSNAITLQSSNTNVTRFTLGTSSTNWTFYSESDAGYLGASSSSSSLTTTTSVSTSNYVTLSFSGSSGATSFKINNRYLNCSQSLTSYRFSTSNSSNTYIRLFKKKIVVDAPTFSVAAGSYNKNLSVSLMTTTAGAAIYYTTDGSTPTTSSTQYTEAINVGEGTTTIKAIAFLKGTSSEVVSATYIVVIPKKEVYHLVTNAATLAEGDTIIFVYGPNTKIMSGQVSDGNRACTKFSFTGDSIVMLKESTDATRIILGGSGNARTFRAINNTEGYLYCSGTEGYLNTQASASDYAKASISIAADGDATIKFASQGSNNLLCYYLDPDAGPGGDDPTLPIVGAKAFLAPVAGSEYVECFTFANAFNEDQGYCALQIYTKNPHEVSTSDINKDGNWTIADVTALVNIILGKDNGEPYQYDHKAADVNNDGTVTIADVTALVNIILGKN